MSRIIPNAQSGITCVCCYDVDAIYRAPVLAWWVEADGDADSEVICSPMVPDETGELRIAKAPVLGLEFPGCTPSDWTAQITAHDERRLKQGAA